MLMIPRYPLYSQLTPVRPTADGGGVAQRNRPASEIDQETIRLRTIATAGYSIRVPLLNIVLEP